MIDEKEKEKLCDKENSEDLKRKIKESFFIPFQVSRAKTEIKYKIVDCTLV